MVIRFLDCLSYQIRVSIVPSTEPKEEKNYLIPSKLSSLDLSIKAWPSSITDFSYFSLLQASKLLLADSISLSK
jgi:hypothetical protein